MKEGRKIRKKERKKKKKKKKERKKREKERNHCGGFITVITNSILHTLTSVYLFSFYFFFLISG